MAATDEALKQLNTLFLESKRTTFVASSGKSGSIRDVLVHRLQAAVERFAIPDSIYAKELAREGRTRYATVSGRLAALTLLATALRDDIEAGWIESVVELAHANAYARLPGDGRVASRSRLQGVIAGTSLEVHLKALATKHGLSLQLPSGGPKKMDALNAELKAAGVYDANQHKQVTAWLALCNSAAHGNYTRLRRGSGQGAG